MKTTLIFFDSLEESKYGTIRGTYSFFMLLFLNFFYFGLSATECLKNRWYIFVIYSLIVASALSVQLPENLSEAAMYGALVGLVIYSTNYQYKKLSSYFWDILFGILSCCLTSVFVADVAVVS